MPMLGSVTVPLVKALPDSIWYAVDITELGSLGAAVLQLRPDVLQFRACNTSIKTIFKYSIPLHLWFPRSKFQNHGLSQGQAVSSYIATIYAGSYVRNGTVPIMVVFLF